MLPSSSPAGHWAQPPESRLPPSSWSERESASYLSSFERIREATSDSPPGDEPLRVAFLGQQSRFGAAAFPAGVDGVEALFVDHSVGSDASHTLKQIRSFHPNVLFAFQPEGLGEVLAGVDSAIKVGVFTDPVAVSGYEGRPALQKRLRDLLTMPRKACDFYIGYNARYAETWTSRVPLMCCMALPVCDDVYCDPRGVPMPDASTGILLGHVTDRQERFLVELKRDHDWTVVDHGLKGGLDDYSIGLNLHEYEVPDYEHRVSLHLARGQLVLTERLTPEYDLQEALHLLNFSEPIQLTDILSHVAADPPRFRRVAVRGRIAAEAFRASKAWTHRLVDIASTL